MTSCTEICISASRFDHVLSSGWSDFDPQTKQTNPSSLLSSVAAASKQKVVKQVNNLLFFCKKTAKLSGLKCVLGILFVVTGAFLFI